MHPNEQYYSRATLWDAFVCRLRRLDIGRYTCLLRASDELKGSWQGLEKQSSQVKDVQHLILLTAQRPGEVMVMPWDEIDFNEALWTTPGSRTKNGLTNMVSLNAQAMQILEKHREALDAWGARLMRIGSGLKTVEAYTEKILPASKSAHTFP